LPGSPGWFFALAKDEPRLSNSGAPAFLAYLPRYKSYRRPSSSTCTCSGQRLVYTYRTRVCSTNTCTHQVHQTHGAYSAYRSPATLVASRARSIRTARSGRCTIFPSCIRSLIDERMKAHLLNSSNIEDKRADRRVVVRVPSRWQRNPRSMNREAQCLPAFR